MACFRFQAQRRMEADRIVMAVQGLWVTLGMQPESELDHFIARADLNALISSDKLQRLRSKELVVC